MALNVNVNVNVNDTLPSWALELARTYQGGAVNTFIIHGNVNDLQPVYENTTLKFVALKQFLIDVLFPQREMIVCYDQSAGIWFPKPTMREDFAKVVRAVDTVQGSNFTERLPREPARALPLIERFLRTRLLDDANYRAAIVLDYAHFVAPAGLGNNFTQDEAASLITLHKWSSDPAFTQADITIVLLCENISDLHPLLVRAPHSQRIQIPLPEQSEREQYLTSRVSLEEMKQLSVLSTQEIAIHTSGLSRVNLSQLLGRARTNIAYAREPLAQKALNEIKDPKSIKRLEIRTLPTSSSSATSAPVKPVISPEPASGRLDLDTLFNEKKAIIEKECFGLLEFIKPKRGLESVSGHEAAKTWLQEDARLLKEGKLDALPMGYLICGPVGTGKTYMMMCYAGSLGIPCVKLMNFRSQWQGVTEGNWEKILNTLKATGPVAVIIDEADASVGSRENSGDSGTSSRVFSMLAQQMGDTHYRGHILWFLLTARPDLLPIDLKRQGRAEVHIPLFYPQTELEKRTYFSILAKKNGGEIKPEDVPSRGLELKLSGSDIEGVVIRAKRRALLASSSVIRPEDLEAELATFSPTTNSDEIELQLMAAIVECTHQSFLPPEYQKVDRAEAAKRVGVLKALLGR